MWLVVMGEVLDEVAHQTDELLFGLLLALHMHGDSCAIYAYNGSFGVPCGSEFGVPEQGEFYGLKERSLYLFGLRLQAHLSIFAVVLPPPGFGVALHVPPPAIHLHIVFVLQAL